MADAFGNALGNSIVGAIQHGNEQQRLEDSFKKAGVAYGYDDNGNVIAQSQSTQSAAEALLRQGASTDDIATVLGDSGIQQAFAGVDEANAALAADPQRLQDSLDDLAGKSAPEVSNPAYYGDNGILHLTVVGGNPNSGLVDALGAVAPVAGALVDLADKSLVAANLLVAAGQAAIGGGGIGQAIKQIGRIAIGQGLEQLQDRASGYVSNRVSEYLTASGGLDSTQIELLSAGAGFGTNLILGSVLGVSSNRIIGDARNVREIVRRPSPRQSEIDVGEQLGSGYRPQVSYKNGQEVRYGTPGSVRPDHSALGSSVEVKNYNVETTAGQGRLVNNVLGQVNTRAGQLPVGTVQQVVIDVRGQNVSLEQLSALRQRIVGGSNGALTKDSIKILTGN